jgi:hypothetical protein
MLHNIADEFGCDWLCSHPLDTSNKESKFQTSRGWNQTKWIVLSSTFFSIPAAYHLYARTHSPTKLPLSVSLDHPIPVLILRSGIVQSIFPYMLVVTSLVSANYWRKATRGWRRNLDLIVAKITFATGLYIAAKYVQSNEHRIQIVIILCFIPVCYNESTKYVNSGNPAWVKYHFAFHVLLSISGAIILRGLTQ